MKIKRKYAGLFFQICYTLEVRRAVRPLERRDFPMLKKIGSSTFVQEFLGFLFFLYTAFVVKTSRWTIEGWPKDRDDGGNSFLLLFWHGRIFATPAIHFIIRPKIKCYVLSSLHRDGRIMASTNARWGAETIDGSASKGGIGAALTIRRALKKSSLIAITPDGRKPAYKMTKGAIIMARDSGCPIMPCSYSSSRAKQLKTWDSFLLPLPFGKAVTLIGEPVFVPKDAGEEDIEKYRQIVEDKLTALMNEADRRVGRQSGDSEKQKQ